MEPFLKCLVGGRRAFHDLSVGETAAPDLSGECGGGKTPPQISRRKHQAGSLGTEEKVPYPHTTLFLTQCIVRNKLEDKKGHRLSPKGSDLGLDTYQSA